MELAQMSKYVRDIQDVTTLALRGRGLARYGMLNGINRRCYEALPLIGDWFLRRRIRKALGL